MSLLGHCFYDEGLKHIIITISHLRDADIFLYVPIFPIEYDDGRCLYYDNACKLEPHEIIANFNKQILAVPSYAVYREAGEISLQSLNIRTNSNLNYRCAVSQEVLLKLQAGAMNSKELEPRFHKYFP